MNRKILISVGGFLLLVLLAFVVFKVMTSKKPKESQIKEFLAVKYVNTQIAEYKDYNAQITATGRVVSDKNIDIYSEVNGIMDLKYDRFKVGNSFKKGDIMIKLNDEESRLSYLAQKSEFLSLLTSIISDLKIDYPQAFDKWNKYISDYSIESNLKDLPQVNNDKEKFFLASRKVFQTFYNIKTLETRLDKYIITAPVNGMVVESLVDPGTLVRVNQKLGRFATSGNHEIEFTVSLDYAGLIRVGSGFTANSDDGQYKYSGRITRISQSIDPGTQTIKMYGSISGGELFDGMYLKADLNGDILNNVLMIQRKAIINNKYIYYIDNGKLAQKEIELVKSSENIAYIRGVDQGTEIINEPIVDAIIGMKVESINKQN